MDLACDLVDLTDAGEGESALTLLKSVVHELSAIRETAKPETLEDLSSSCLVRMAQKITNPDKPIGLTTGYKALDKMIDGLQPSQYYIIGARPGMGKTAFGLNLAHSALKAGHPVLFVSLEMTADKLMERLLTRWTDRSLPEERTLDAWRQAAADIARLPLTILDTKSLPEGCSPSSVRTAIRQAKQAHGAGVVIVDYLGKLQPSLPMAGANKVHVVEAISGELQDIAKMEQVPLVTLSQLNRAIEAQQDKKPRLSDLRDSGSIEQDADVVIFIHRPEYYEKQACKRPGEADIIVAKNRHGSVGDVVLGFRGQSYKFYEYPGGYGP
jgi:replicative DNA helicase